MRWSLGRLLIVVLIVGLALGTYRIFWGHSSYFNSRILFAVYLAALTTTSLAVCLSRQRWRRLWLGSALYGWIYLLLVLRGGFGFTPDVYAENLSRFSVLGMIMGSICGLVAHLLPGLRERGERDPSAG
jgi:hypothetical protein